MHSTDHAERKTLGPVTTPQNAAGASVHPLEVKKDRDARPTMIAVITVMGTVVGIPVMARVAATVIAARSVSVTPVPVAFRTPMAIMSMIDLLSRVSLHLRGFRHEDRGGV